MVAIQRRFQRDLVDTQKATYQASEKNFVCVFLIAQPIIFLLCMTSVVYDRLNCTKEFRRFYDFTMYIAFIAAYVFIYPRLVWTVKDSANDAFRTHQNQFNVTMAVVITVLVIKAILACSYIIASMNIELLQWTNTLNDMLVIIPIFFYTQLVKRDEDSLNNFNRHATIEVSSTGKNVLFSRFQSRRSNNIEQETLKYTADYLNQQNKSQSFANTSEDCSQSYNTPNDSEIIESNRASG